jgi:hypothetical protein
MSRGNWREPALPTHRAVAHSPVLVSEEAVIAISAGP